MTESNIFNRQGGYQHRYQKQAPKLRVFFSVFGAGFFHLSTIELPRKCEQPQPQNLTLLNPILGTSKRWRGVNSIICWKKIAEFLLLCLVGQYQEYTFCLEVSTTLESGLNQFLFWKKTNAFLLCYCRSTFCDQKSPRYPKVGFLQRHRYKTDIATTRLNQPQGGISERKKNTNVSANGLV